MIFLLNDAVLCSAGIKYTIPREFMIVSVECFEDGEKLVFKPRISNCLIELRTITGSPKDNVRDEFLNKVGDKKRFKLHGKVDERIEWYMYTIRAVYESSETEYFEMRFGQVRGYPKRLELLITSTEDTPMSEILESYNMDGFIKSFEILQYASDKSAPYDFK